MDILDALELKKFPDTFKTTPGFCPNRPNSINGLSSSGSDVALKTDEPFSYSKVLTQTFSSKGFSLVTTLKIPATTDDIVLTRFAYADKTFEIVIGAGELIILYNNNGREEFTFDLNLKDGRWHRMAVGVRENRLSLYMDCVLIGQKSLKKMFSISTYDKVSIMLGERAVDKAPGFVVRIFIRLSSLYIRYFKLYYSIKILSDFYLFFRYFLCDAI